MKNSCVRYCVVLWIVCVIAVGCRSDSDSEERITEEILHDRLNIYTKKWVGSKQFGTILNDFAAGIAVNTTADNNFDVFVAGFSQTNDEQENVLLVKYDFSGDKKWTADISGIKTSFSDIVNSLAVANSGVFVIGNTSGEVDENINQGEKDFFLLMYNYFGEEQWNVQLGTSSDDIASDVFVDNGGNIFITGYTTGELFATKPDQTHDGKVDLFMVRYTAIGVIYPGANKQLLTISNDYARGIAVDNTGNKYITGDTSGDMEVSYKDDNKSAGKKDLFLLRYNSYNSLQWIRQIGTSENDIGCEVAVDASGDIYVAGVTWGDLDSTGDEQHVGGTDVFLMKYDSTGDQLWIKQLGTTGDEYVTGMTIDSNEDIYITGSTTGDLDGNTNAGDSDIFLIKYNKLGEKLWSKLFGTISQDSSSDIAIDTVDNLYLSGSTTGGFDGNTNLDSSGTSDIFLMKLDTSGDSQ